MAESRATATVTPQPDGGECDATGCTITELLANVEPDALDRRRVLCPKHRVEWLREVSSR